MTSAPGASGARGASAAASFALLLVGVALAMLAMHEMFWKPDDLPVLGQVPPFSLLDQDGATLSEQRLSGRPWVASFIYTSCQGPCPILVEKLALLRRRVAQQSLAIVSFSVDPDTDTVEVLRAYAKAHRVSSSQSWWLATGRREDVLTLIQKGFLSAVGRETSIAGAATGPLLHSTRFILIDGQGRIRGAYASDDPADLARLEEEAEDLPSPPAPKRD